MTRLWPNGDPIVMTLDAEGLPDGFTWRGRRHPVDAVANRWRVQAAWWSPEAMAWREYYKLATVDGLLCLVYQDLRDGAWFCARLYD
jgi:hypothetical protein